MTRPGAGVSSKAHRVRPKWPSRPLLWAILTAVLSSGDPIAAADPFYEDQLRHGQLRLQAGEYDVAARSLRVASFGLLNEPVRLAEALTYLALAQAQIGDADGFAATFERIVVIEQRFGAYTQLEDRAAKAALEERLPERIPSERLSSIEVFSRVAEDHATKRAEAMGPATRRKELRRRLAETPDDIDLLLQAARLELAEGRERRAAQFVERAVGAHPERTEAHCLNVGLATALDRCEPALTSWPLCPGSAATDPADEFLLSCLVRRARWAEASSVAAGLPEARREHPPVAALISEIARQSPQGVEVQPAGAAPAATPTAGADTETTDAEALTQIRELFEQARQPSDLDEPLRRARELADERPDSQDAQFLAAEIAYRGARWDEAVSFFRRGGEPTPEKPLLLFYYAVSLFESGDSRAAAEALERALPALARTPFVESYSRRILGRSGAPS